MDFKSKIEELNKAFEKASFDDVQVDQGLVVHSGAQVDALEVTTTDKRADDLA